MEIERTIGNAPRTRALGQAVTGLHCGCIGCRDCAGLCPALIEMLCVPGVVLKAGDP